MRRFLCLVLMATFTFAAFARDGVVRIGHLDRPYASSGLALKLDRCDASADRCQYEAQHGRVVAVGGGPRDPVSEVAGYFIATTAGAARATNFLAASMATFSGNIGRVDRTRMVVEMVREAADKRRSERTLAGVTYVLRASDGRDVRIYVTLP